MKKTEDMIEHLVGDLARPTEARGWRARLAGLWLIAVASVGGLTLWAKLSFPDRIRLPDDLSGAQFVARGLLLLTLFAVCAHASYLASLPAPNLRRVRVWAAALIGALGLVLALATEPFAFINHVMIELDGSQGPCGVFIALTGALAGGLILKSFRRAFPGEAGAAGFWTLAAAGVLSSFFMQLVCRHETSAHVLIWHALPVVLIAYLGRHLAARYLN